MPDLSLAPPACGYILAAIFGAIIGSFLNVVIHRVPLEESVVFPNSRCPSCGAVIAFYDNIPVVSWMLLRAKCRGCRQPISFRYPAVELLTAALFVAVAWHDGLSVALPFLFFGFWGVVMALFMHRAVKPETIERVRRRNPVSPYERHDPALHRRSNRGWESSFDSEVQRLRRKSLGLD